MLMQAIITTISPKAAGNCRLISIAGEDLLLNFSH
jgi:hypothetical protein